MTIRIRMGMTGDVRAARSCFPSEGNQVFFRKIRFSTEDQFFCGNPGFSSRCPRFFRKNKFFCTTEENESGILKKILITIVLSMAKYLISHVAQLLLEEIPHNFCKPILKYLCKSYIVLISIRIKHHISHYLLIWGSLFRIAWRCTKYGYNYKCHKNSS